MTNNQLDRTNKIIGDIIYADVKMKSWLDKYDVSHNAYDLMQANSYKQDIIDLSGKLAKYMQESI